MRLRISCWSSYWVCPIFVSRSKWKLLSLSHFCITIKVKTTEFVPFLYQYHDQSENYWVCPIFVSRSKWKLLSLSHFIFCITIKVKTTEFVPFLYHDQSENYWVCPIFVSRSKWKLGTVWYSHRGGLKLCLKHEKSQAISHFWKWKWLINTKSKPSNITNYQ